MRVLRVPLLVDRLRTGKYKPASVPHLNQLFDLTGRVAIVTGGSRGLGLEIAEGLAEAGARLMLCARREQWLTPALTDLRARGVTVEGTLGDARGMMNLCIPFNSIERISNRLSSNNWVGYGKKSATAESIKRISDQLHGAEVEVIVDLAETNISTADLIGLRVGDIIATEKDIQRPLVVSIEGRPKFHAQAGAFKGRKAIQLIGPIS